MRLVKIFVIFFLLIFNVFIMAKGKEIKERIVNAYYTEDSIEIDGILNEKVWKNKGYDGFVQSEPVDGAKPTEKTIVWVAYSKNALYIAARMFDSEPEKIISLLGRRDDFLDSDWFAFSIDPYFDRRSGYKFAVNPAGSIIDLTLFNDEWDDETWDGVWKSAVKIDDKGWVVEMEIPFDQLRFKKKNEYIWGVNFERIIKRKNENVGFVWIPKEESGFVSRFAKLKGIKDISPGHFFELLPYTVGKATFSPEEEGNPFCYGKELFVNAGLDMKIGLKSNLTLNLTLNPDFGQVEVDPARINLSASELYYMEKRPFFVEGANIFRFGRGGSNSNWGVNWGNPSFFYSRRIGAAPHAYDNIDGYVKYPEWSTILGAAKISGKIGKDWNIGVLSAFTQREYAEIDLDGERLKKEVEPFSFYNVFRAQKEFNKGCQGLGFIYTYVSRNLRTEDLINSLNKSAFNLGVDGWTFLDKDKMWVLSGWFGTTRVSGSKDDIIELQKAYLHYFQRPDATHIEVDIDATSLSGWSGRLAINKQKGNLALNIAIGAVSPGFDTTDMGFQWMGDVINAHIMTGYRSFHPGKIFREWRLFLGTQRNYDFGGNKIGEQRLLILGEAQFLNYWRTDIQISYNPGNFSSTLTRGGPLMSVPAYTWGDFSLSSDNRKPMKVSFEIDFFTSKSGSWSYSPSFELQWKPKSNLSFSIEPSYEYSYSIAQWVTNVEDEFMTETYNNRYIFSIIDQKTLSCVLRLNWIFSPKLSIQAYIQPYISVGAYSGFKELARPKSFDFNIYGGNNSYITYSDETYFVDPDASGPAPEFSFEDPNFNYKSIRGTVVLRWEYKPGSIFYFVWTQNRNDYSNPGEFSFSRDIRDMLGAPGDNIFMIKFTYRFSK